MAKSNSSVPKSPSRRRDRVMEPSRAGRSSKRTKQGGKKKVRQTPSTRQPKQAPRNLAVGKCANCGCTQADTCLWRTHPSLDGNGGKVKLCNACGIHIRDKGFNRLVTEEMRRRQSLHAKAARLSWAALNGSKSGSDDDTFDTSGPSSPTSSTFSANEETPLSPPTTTASAPSSPVPVPKTSPAGIRKNTHSKVTLKASPKSKGCSKPRSAPKTLRPAPLKLEKSNTSAVKAIQLQSPTSPTRKPKKIIPRIQDEKAAEPMSVEDAAGVLCDLVHAAWGVAWSLSGSDCGSSSDTEGSGWSQPVDCLSAQAASPGVSYHYPGSYPTPSPDGNYHSFSAYQSSHSWCSNASFKPYDCSDGNNFVQTVTPPITPTLIANNTVGVLK